MSGEFDAVELSAHRGTMIEVNTLAEEVRKMADTDFAHAHDASKKLMKLLRSKLGLKHKLEYVETPSRFSSTEEA